MTVIQLMLALAELNTAGHGNRQVIVNDSSDHVLIVDGADYDPDNKEVFLTHTVDGM